MSNECIFIKDIFWVRIYLKIKIITVLIISYIFPTLLHIKIKTLF